MFFFIPRLVIRSDFKGVGAERKRFGEEIKIIFPVLFSPRANDFSFRVAELNLVVRESGAVFIIDRGKRDFLAFFESYRFRKIGGEDGRI